MIPLTALNRWLVIQALFWSVALVFVAWATLADRTRLWMGWPGAAALILSYVGLWMILRCGRRFADWVTLLRFALLLVVVVLVTTGHGIGWGIWSLMVAVVASDLLDGWCARIWGGSPGGALLDMETDQFTTLVLSVIATALVGAGFWTLLLPAFKYGYVLGLLGIGIPAHDPKPRSGDNRRGRLICAGVMVLLLAALCPWASPLGARICTIVAVLALAYSFSSDARFLWQHRGDVFGNR